MRLRMKIIIRIEKYMSKESLCYGKELGYEV